MKLRGHHVFCTALFSGHGYDEKFTDKMYSIISEWKSGEIAEIQISCDEICSACPNKSGSDSCLLGTEDVFQRDNAALKVLGLQVNRKVSWKQARELLKKISDANFQEVCGNCRWQQEGLCSYEMLMQKLDEM